MNPTRDRIINAAIQIFALHGYQGVSMRVLAKQAGISVSVLYYHFKDKDALLEDMFNVVNTRLGNKRSHLPIPQTAFEMLRQRIEFQMDHGYEIVAVLKYYITYRSQFKKHGTGYVPDKGYLHIEEVFHHGVTTGELEPIRIREQAKVITHAINGFILEYYPFIPHGRERETLVETIHAFLWRSVIKKGESA